MKDFMISILATAIAGSLVSSIFPKSEIEKPLLFLCGAVVTATIIAIFVGFNSTNMNNFDLTTINGTFYSENRVTEVYQDKTKEIIENELSKLVYEMFDVVPENVSVNVSYENENFFLEKAEMTVKYENISEIFDYLQKKTGISVIIYEGKE